VTRVAEQPWLLIVEDDPDDSELAMVALERCGVRCGVRTARDGVEALALLDAEPSTLPRLVLLDLKMPRMDGVELAERCRGDQRLREVPLVMLTSSAESRDIERAYCAGVNSFVVKPVEIDDFFAAVGQVGRYWIDRNHGPDRIFRGV
jgi:two-component system, response regulator